MTQLISLNLNLSQGQREKLRKAYENNSNVSLQVTNENIENGGNATIGISQREYNKVMKNKSQGRGARIKIPQSNIKEQKTCGFLGTLAAIGIPLAIQGISALVKKLRGGSQQNNWIAKPISFGPSTRWTLW